MAQIYLIRNSVNNKVYVGKTETTYTKRFKEHLQEYSKPRCNKRPLYDAMTKYGVDNFYVQLLCETLTPEIDEIRFIKEYNSYIGFSNSNGYNATLGGDGKKYITINDEDIVKEYLIEMNNTILKVAIKFSICADSVRTILHNNSITIRSSAEYIKRAVKQYKKDGTFIKAFKSAKDAATNLGKNDASHINACIRGTRKSAYGFIWVE